MVKNDKNIKNKMFKSFMEKLFTGDYESYQ